MKRSPKLSLLGGGIVALAFATGILGAVVVACDSSSDVPHDTLPQADSSTPKDSAQPPPPVDTGVTVLPDGNVVINDATPPPPVSDCFTNPKTHFEIINACTDAQSIDKNPTLPLLLPDGGLPLPP